MAIDLGKARVTVEPMFGGQWGVFGVVIAAANLHQAIYYSDLETIKALPDNIARAYVELGRALGTFKPQD
jgi:hypothetical protein